MKKCTFMYNSDVKVVFYGFPRVKPLMHNWGCLTSALKKKQQMLDLCVFHDFTHSFNAQTTNPTIGHRYIYLVQCDVFLSVPCIPSYRVTGSLQY